MLLIIDDFHCVQTIKDPKQSQLSKCIHMCTAVVDNQTSLSAITATKPVHQDTPVRKAGGEIVPCRGGINANKVNELFRGYMSTYFMHSYLDCLPDEYSRFDMMDFNKSLVELRLDIFF